jgi:sigma-B regulation protein RsbU (phosphoserine phosphatase)
LPVPRSPQAGSRWLLVSLLASSVVALVDVLVPGSAILISVLIVGPLLAAMNLGGGQTAVAGAYSLVLAIVLGIPDGIFASGDHLVLCLVIAVGGGFCALLAARRTQSEQELARMTRVAEVAQQAILRPVPARVGGVLFAARYLSATQEALIGGDFYDVAASPYGLRVVVGDVKGKGVDAVRLASLVLGSFRGAAFIHRDLVEVASDLDRSIAGHLGDEDFVTAVMVEFGQGGSLEMVNCGHPPPLLLHNGSAELLSSPSPSTPLGLRPSPVAQRLTLAPSDRLLLYTDGLVEARAADGHFFDLNGEATRALAARSLSEALDDLVKRVLDHVGGHLDDDMALVLAQPRRQITRRRAA